MEITLDMLLASRDERQRRQRELLAKYPTLTLLCLTVIMPGRVKRNHESLTVAKAAVKVLCKKFGKESLLEEHDLETGYEAYFTTSLGELEAKRLTCELEERHPLGRLFDIDVIGHDGKPVARTAVSIPPRRCLLCQQEARFCMRNHSHSQEEILQHIRMIVSNYTDN